MTRGTERINARSIELSPQVLLARSLRHLFAHVRRAVGPNPNWESTHGTGARTTRESARSRISFSTRLASRINQCSDRSTLTSHLCLFLGARR